MRKVAKMMLFLTFTAAIDVSFAGKIQCCRAKTSDAPTKSMEVTPLTIKELEYHYFVDQAFECNLNIKGIILTRLVLLMCVINQSLYRIKTLQLESCYQHFRLL